MPPNELAERIGAQYKQALIRQVYKLVLNIDTLSQPAILVLNFGAGVKVRARARAVRGESALHARHCQSRARRTPRGPLLSL